jgi:Putative sensor
MSAAGLDGDRRARANGSRLPLYGNPVRLIFSASLWRAVGYLLSYLATSGVLFGVVLAAAVASGVLAFTVVALPLLTAAAYVVHGCAAAERYLLRQVIVAPIRSRYPQVSQLGWLARTATVWRDAATWRELAYLGGLWAPLWALNLALVIVWLTCIAGIAMPLWYRFAWTSCPGSCAGQKLHGVSIGNFPHGPHGPGAYGLFVDTLPKALLAAAGFLILFLLSSYLIVLTARMNARVAHALLRPPADPLAEVKNVLTGQGPLGPLSPASG